MSAKNFENCPCFNLDCMFCGRDSDSLEFCLPFDDLPTDCDEPCRPDEFPFDSIEPFSLDYPSSCCHVCPYCFHPFKI